MDSPFSTTKRISSHSKQQICAKVKCPLPSMKIRVLRVKQQSNASDCGLYAIAFVYHILQGKQNPKYVNFNQETMRHQLLRSLLADSVGDFPLTTRKAMFCNEMMEVLELHCICGLCWVHSDKNQSSR